MKRRDLLAVAASTVAAPWVHAQSGAWPTRGNIRLICQYPPGGLVDTVARLLAPHLSQALSQTVVVENRAGAGGLIGTEFASRQPADGYTLLVSHASVHPPCKTCWVDKLTACLTPSQPTSINSRQVHCAPWPFQHQIACQHCPTFQPLLNWDSTHSRVRSGWVCLHLKTCLRPLLSASRHSFLSCWQSQTSWRAWKRFKPCPAKRL